MIWRRTRISQSEEDEYDVVVLVRLKGKKDKYEFVVVVVIHLQGKEDK